MNSTSSLSALLGDDDVAAGDIAEPMAEGGEVGGLKYYTAKLLSEIQIG